MLIVRHGAGVRAGRSGSVCLVARVIDFALGSPLGIAGIFIGTFTIKLAPRYLPLARARSPAASEGKQSPRDLSASRLFRRSPKTNIHTGAFNEFLAEVHGPRERSERTGIAGERSFRFINESARHGAGKNAARIDESVRGCTVLADTLNAGFTADLLYDFPHCPWGIRSREFCDNASTLVSIV